MKITPSLIGSLTWIAMYKTPIAAIKKPTNINNMMPISYSWLAIEERIKMDTKKKTKKVVIIAAIYGKYPITN